MSEIKIDRETAEEAAVLCAALGQDDIANKIRALLDAPQDIPLEISRLNNLEWLLERIDEMHAILCPERIGTWQQRTEHVRDAVLRLAPKQQPELREAFETDAAARGHDVTRLGDSYARLETHLRWRGFQAGFAAGRKA